MTYVLIIIAFNLIIFFRKLQFSICVDDIRHYGGIQNGNFDFKFLSDPIRWIKLRFYGGGTLGRAKPGEAPDAHYDHLFGIFLHTLASVLVFYAFGHNQVSFWAAILYSCNPTNTQTSVWLNGRRYLMNVILVLLIVIFPLAGIPLYLATGLFHVTAVAAPILFLGWFTIPAAALFYLCFRDYINDRIEKRYRDIHSKDWREFTPKRLIVIVKVYGFHFFKMIFPGITLMNYPTLFMWGVTKKGNDDAYAFNYDFYLGIVAAIISVAVLVLVPTQYKPYVIFMIAAILQWSAIIPAVQLLADRYTSTAMPFMMFFLAYFIHNPVILALIAGFYVARLWSCMEMFTSIWHYYKYQIYHAPQITTPRKDLVNYCIHMGDFFKALTYIREGLELDPTDFSLLHRAAICAKAVGSRKNALEYLVKAEQNFYIDQEESQKAWCDMFKSEMKKEDFSTLGRKK